MFKLSQNDLDGKSSPAQALPFKILEKIVDKPLRVRGIAIQTGMSRNRNIYTAEELEAFASRLEGSPFYVEHVAVPNAIGKVVKAWWDPQAQAVWYEAEIYDDEIAEKIRKGLIQHVSVGADYERIDVLDGKVPHGLHNAELSLVAVPGIPETNIQVLESLQATTEPQDFIFYSRQSLAPQPVGVQPGAAPPSAVGEKNMNENTNADMKEKANANANKPPVLKPLIAERVWTRRYINDLPDSSFALILPGGERDETGRTKPRSLRMFPYKDAQGRVDLPHLRNANARLPQAKIPEDQREKARRVLVAVKKKLGIGAAAEEMKLYEEINADEIVPEKIEALPEPTLDELVASLEDEFEEVWAEIEKIKAQLAVLSPALTEQKKLSPSSPAQQPSSLAESLVQKPREPLMPVAEAIQILESLLLSPAVERSTLGEQHHHQQIRREIWKLKERMKNG